MGRARLTGVEIAARICTDHVKRIREDFAASVDDDKPVRLPREDLEDVLMAAEFLFKVDRANAQDAIKILELTGDREGAIAVLRDRKEAMTGDDEGGE